MLSLLSMKKQFIKIILLSFAFFSFFNFAHADTSIHLTIKTPNTTLYNQDISVAACDSDQLGTMKITPYCAILQSGVSSDWNWAWAPSAFLNSLGGVAGYTSKDKDNNDVYHYWSWSLNGSEAWDALNQYDLQPGDLINLDFIDPGNPASVVLGGQGLVEEKDKPKIVSSTDVDFVADAPSNSSVQNIVFNQSKALEFLASQQREDGSMGNALLTDWSALAFATGQDSKPIISLVKFISNSKLVNLSLTDAERRAMSLMSLGLNPYNAYKENYINKIISSFDGEQFGDKSEDNDDIFALIVLKNVGYTREDKIISQDLDFLIKKQKNDGSWDGSVDMTGAGVLALSNFFDKNLVLSDAQSVLIEKSLTQARIFLKSTQKSDGGWGNIFSTAWAMEGILGLGEKPVDWTINSSTTPVVLRTPIDFLIENQDPDGGMKNSNLENKIWGTAYVSSVISGKTWNQIMQVFSREKITKANSVNYLAEQNLASVINANLNTQTDVPQKREEKRGWIRGFLRYLFGF